MAFCTGSVVVPRTSETTARFWPVTAFSTLDFPAFLRPKKPICTRSALGVSFIPMAVPSFNQNRKSRIPFSIFTRLSRTICCTFSLGMFPISCAISASPMRLVSSEA